MKVVIGADHRGFELKEKLGSWLIEKGYEVVDKGAFEYDEDDDFVDFAVAVGREVAGSLESKAEILDLEVKCRGLVICGSGVGVSIAANKVKGVRCAMALNEDQVRDSRMHDDFNVLSLASDYIDFNQAKNMVKIFLDTEFLDKERYRRRIEKIGELENN